MELPVPILVFERLFGGLCTHTQSGSEVMRGVRGSLILQSLQHLDSHNSVGPSKTKDVSIQLNHTKPKKLPGQISIQ